MDELIGQHAHSEEFNRSLLRAIAEASPDGILVVDENSVVVSHNQRFLEIWNIPEDYMQSSSHSGGIVSDNTLLHVALEQLKDPDAFLRRVQELYENPYAVDQTEIEFKDGRILERHSSGLFSDTGLYLGRVWFFRDITWRKQVELELKQRARRDPLTGVMNRGYFFERGTVELERARRYQRPLAVLMLDLDRFKWINDRHGHAVGDEVLRTASQRWLAVLRSSDLLGRIGGEEFAILLPDADPEAAGAVAERLRLAVSEQDISTGGRAIQCTVSIGVTRFLVGDGCMEHALRRADMALYRAKANGRNRIELEPRIAE